MCKAGESLLHQRFLCLVAPACAMAIGDVIDLQVCHTFIGHEADLLAGLMCVLHEVPLTIVTGCLMAVAHFEDLEIGATFVGCDKYFDVCL